MKKATPKSSKTCEAKPSSSVKHLMDIKAQIVDPSGAYHLVDLQLNLYGSRVKG